MEGTKSLIEHFSLIRYPRIDRTKTHLIIEIIVMAIIAVLCGS